MSAFAIFVLVLTVIYVIYYSAIIMQDLYAKKDVPKTEEEDFDVSQMQNQEEPISITEGETKADVMVNMLLNQKPGGPKIFYSRNNI